MAGSSFQFLDRFDAGRQLAARLVTMSLDHPIDDPDFATAFDRFAETCVVLLGEASHGTSEFCQARAAITRRLIEEHRFTIIAAEADWPDAAAIDRYVRQRPHQSMNARPFARLPTWMWRNKDVDVLRQFPARLQRRKVA